MNEKILWEHCYVIAGHSKKLFAKTEDEAIELKQAFCLETITKLW